MAHLFGGNISASTQWELVQPAAAIYSPVYEKMQDYAADGHLIHNDDTTMTVLELTPVQYAPPQLFLAGKRDLLQRGRRVSVIGSRKASLQGLRRAPVLARSLVEHGIAVVSGLAARVDRAAHEAAIVSGGDTIAVIGTALDRCYPMENSELQHRIAREQLLISPFPAGHPVTPENFPIRNRTMALLTDATVIVEAGEKSGTLLQGWETLRLGRLLLLLEGVATDPTLSWPRDLIRHGAQILSRQNLEIALENVPAFTAATTIASEA